MVPNFLGVVGILTFFMVQELQLFSRCEPQGPTVSVLVNWNVKTSLDPTLLVMIADLCVAT